jgi:hypothetical protein
MGFRGPRERAVGRMKQRVEFARARGRAGRVAYLDEPGRSTHAPEMRAIVRIWEATRTTLNP